MANCPIVSRNPSPYHNDSSFFQHTGALTAEDWETDTKDLIEAVTLFQAGKKKANQMLKTVRRNFKGMTKQEMKEASLAKTLQSRVGNMIDTKFK